jgi:AraC-like DNA-binding protein
LLERFGLDRGTLAAREIDLPLRVVRELPEAIAGVLGDPHLGLHLASFVAPGAYGWVELLVRSAPTLRAAAMDMARYGALLRDHAVFTVEDHGDEALVSHFMPGEPELFGRHANELTLAYLVRVGRELWQRPDWAPRQLTFAHAAPAERGPLEAFFGSKDLLFSAGKNALVVERRAFDAPIWSRDATVRATLASRAAELLDNEPVPADFWSRLMHELGRALPDGDADAMLIAKRLGMSRRTLQRRLAEEQMTFRGVIEDLRCKLALAYLTSDEAPLDQLADRLGYSDVRALLRAFKRWTGMTPGQYRQRTAVSD